MAESDSTTDPDDDLARIEGIGDSYAEELHSAGVDSVGDLADADASALSDETAVEEGRLAEFVERAQEATDGAPESDDGATNDDGDTTADPDDGGGSDESGDRHLDADEPVQLHEVRDVVEDLARELIRHPLDGVVEIEPGEEEGEWHANVEVIERSAVPDTQDILGRYALTVGADGSVQSYQRVRRYRRGDVGE